MSYKATVKLKQSLREDPAPAAILKMIASVFIVSTTQHVRFGFLSLHM